MKIIDGLTQKFQINDQVYEIDYRITVLADCGNSMFRKFETSPSSEFCREFPIRVLLHNVKVTHTLVDGFAKALYDRMNAFELELVISRQKDDNVQPPQNQRDNSQLKIETRGGSIYNSLEAGLFALGLLSKDMLPGLILVTGTFLII